MAFQPSDVNLRAQDTNTNVASYVTDAVTFTAGRLYILHTTAMSTTSADPLNTIPDSVVTAGQTWTPIVSNPVDAATDNGTASYWTVGNGGTAATTVTHGEEFANLNYKIFEINNADPVNPVVQTKTGQVNDANQSITLDAPIGAGNIMLVNTYVGNRNVTPSGANGETTIGVEDWNWNWTGYSLTTTDTMAWSLNTASGLNAQTAYEIRYLQTASEPANEWYNGNWWREPTYGDKWYGPAGLTVVETFTIRFNGEVYYVGDNPTALDSSVEGLEFTRDGTSALDVRHSTDMTGPNTVIQYSVFWPSIILPGEEVRFIYTGATGKYENAEGLAMTDQNLLMTNCADALLGDTVTFNGEVVTFNGEDVTHG